MSQGFLYDQGDALILRDDITESLLPEIKEANVGYSVVATADGWDFSYNKQITYLAGSIGNTGVLTVSAPTGFSIEDAAKSGSLFILIGTPSTLGMGYLTKVNFDSTSSLYYVNLPITAYSYAEGTNSPNCIAGVGSGSLAGNTLTLNFTRKFTLEVAT